MKGEEIKTRVNNHLELPEVSGLRADELLVNETVSHVRSLQVAGRPVLMPATGAEFAAVPRAARTVVEGAGLDVWTPVEFIALIALSTVTRFADCFVDILEVEYRLALLEEEYRDLVHFISTRMTLGALTSMLRLLVREQVSIRNLRAILQQLADYDTISVPNAGLAVFDHRLPLPDGPMLGLAEESHRHREFVRLGLSGQIHVRHLRDPESLFACSTSRRFEARVEAVRDDDDREQIRDLFWPHLAEATRLGLRPIVLTSVGGRAALRDILGPELPQLPILTNMDVGPNIRFGRVKRIDEFQAHSKGWAGVASRDVV